MTSVHPPQDNLREEYESARSALLGPLSRPSERGGAIVRDPDVTLLVAVARPYPDRLGIRVELHRVDVPDGPRRKLEGFVPALSFVAALPDADRVLAGFGGVLPEVDHPRRVAGQAERHQA